MPTCRYVRETVRIPCGNTTMEADLAIPPGASGLVLFSHENGGNRSNLRNDLAVRFIRESGIGTLVLAQSSAPKATGFVVSHPFSSVVSLAGKLMEATQWVARRFPRCRPAIFGSGSGGAAAVMAAAEMDGLVGAVVSRNGHPDMVPCSLPRLGAPVLLIVGENDGPAIKRNEAALDRIPCQKSLCIVPHAARRSDKSGSPCEEAARLAANWFWRHLRPQTPACAGIRHRGTFSGDLRVASRKFQRES